MAARKKLPGTDQGSAAAKQDQDRSRPVPRLNASPVITHSEVASRVEQGGCLRGVLLEAQEDDACPNYAVILLSSWRNLDWFVISTACSAWSDRLRLQRHSRPSFGERRSTPTAQLADHTWSKPRAARRPPAGVF